MRTAKGIEAQLDLDVSELERIAQRLGETGRFYIRHGDTEFIGTMEEYRAVHPAPAVSGQDTCDLCGQTAYWSRSCLTRSGNYHGVWRLCWTHFERHGKTVIENSDKGVTKESLLDRLATADVEARRRQAWDAEREWHDYDPQRRRVESGRT